MLYGASSNALYTSANLAILGASESYSFGGYSESSAENGPFHQLSVLAEVTNRTLKIGIRVSGKGTAQGYDFSASIKGDAVFLKFDHFILTEISMDATLSGITLISGSLDTDFTPQFTPIIQHRPKGLRL